MLSKFWESIGTNVADRWLEYVFGPAFIFWVGGFGSYAWKIGWQTVFTNVAMLTSFQQGSMILLTLLVLVFSSILMKAIRFPILRLLEGYWPWPFSKLRTGIVALKKKNFQKRYDELRILKKASEKKDLFDSEQREKLIQLEDWAHWHPAQPDDLLPTELGNILRARERSPERKYGLDAVICWPRLWPLLPEHVRIDLANARSSLDRLAELWFWGVLFLFWTPWLPWAAAIGLIWIFVIYKMAGESAMAYGDLLESAFDLHRLSLYDAVGWQRPANNEEEKSLGTQMTEFFWRGTLSKQMTYQSKKK